MKPLLKLQYHKKCASEKLQSSSSDTVKLPPEVRVIIFEHFYRSLSVTIRCDQDEKSLISRPRRKSSACDILLVSRLFYHEAEQYFWKYTTFCIVPETCRSIANIPSRIFSNIKSLRIIGNDVGNGRLIEYPECLNSLTKLECITYEGRFSVSEGGLLHHGEGYRSYISDTLRYATSVNFRLNPTYSWSPARICAVSTNGGTEVIVRGWFMHDVENVALRVYKLNGFGARTIFRLEKTFAKPRSKVVRFGHFGQMIEDGKVDT